MSWSASFTVKDDDVIDDSVVESGVEPDQHSDQYEEALNCVWSLLRSGVVGGDDKEYRVILSGHGNPNHEPASGWANDCVTIQVVQV